MVENVDFKKVYSNNIQAGDRARIWIEGLGNYLGEFTEYFTIWPRDINEVDFLAKESYIFTGEEIIPEYRLEFETMALVKGIDFEVEFQNNIATGTAMMIATGIGNYTETLIFEYEIVKANIQDTDITIYRPVYTSEPVIPQVTILYREKPLVIDTDFLLTATENINVSQDTAELTITGINNFEGEYVSKFDILPRPISDEAIIFNVESPLTYNGLAQIPNVEIKLNNYVLVEGTDYTLVGENNTNASDKATLVFTGIGNFSSETKKYFTILPTDAEGFVLELENERFLFTGFEIKPKAKVTLNGEQYTDIVVTYKDNIDATPAATAIVEVKGNYSGFIEKNFSISPVSLKSCKASSPSYSFANKDIDAKLILQLGDYVFKENIDYKITDLQNNFDVGTGSLTYQILTENIVEKDQSFNQSFDILAEDISNCSISYVDKNLIYSGQELMPDFALYLNDSIVDKKNYSYEYANNINAGTAAEVKLIGRNNLKNKATQLFSIEQATLNIATCNIVADQYADATKEGLYDLDTMKVYYLDNMLLEVEKDYTFIKDSEDVLKEEVVKTTVLITGQGNFKGSYEETFPTEHLPLGANLIQRIEKKPGYTYIQYTESMEPLFATSRQGKSAIDELNTQLYNHGYANESVSINAVPIYYLKPNTIVLIHDDATNINGEYVISKINIPLGNSGTMSLTATKAGKRVY